MVASHKPLLTLLGPKSPIPSLAAARLQNWEFILTVYNYDIQFQSSINHRNEDGLSQLLCHLQSQKIPLLLAIYSANVLWVHTHVISCNYTRGKF